MEFCASATFQFLLYIENHQHDTVEQNFTWVISDWLTFFPLQEVNESPETLKYVWYPELEIYGLETFGRQRVLKEMSGVRLRKNKTINYELG